MTRFKIRETAVSTEFWDNEEMKIISIPKGCVPNFQYTYDISSLVSVDLSNTKDTTVINGEVIPEEEPKIEKETSDDKPTEVETEDDALTNESLDKMTIPQLRELAKEKEIDIPGAVKANGDIIQLIQANTK